jgi:hypothetical protein
VELADLGAFGPVITCSSLYVLPSSREAKLSGIELFLEDTGPEADDAFPVMEVPVGTHPNIIRTIIPDIALNNNFIKKLSAF